jgi:hypothetical protein
MGVAMGAGCADRIACERGTLAGVGTGITGGAIAGVGIGAAMDGVGAGSGRMGCAAGSDSEHLPDCVVLRGLAGGPTCR